MPTKIFVGLVKPTYKLLNGEITVFPESVKKLSIIDRKDVVDFVKENKSCPFREWTTVK